VYHITKTAETENVKRLPNPQILPHQILHRHQRPRHIEKQLSSYGKLSDIQIEEGTYNGYLSGVKLQFLQVISTNCNHNLVGLGYGNKENII